MVCEKIPGGFKVCDANGQLLALGESESSDYSSRHLKEASMEEDIVERLRKESHGVTVNLNPWPTMREAADEIERLRAELKIQDEAKDILSSTAEEFLEELELALVRP